MIGCVGGARQGKVTSRGWKIGYVGGGWMIGCVRGGKARKSNIEGVDERLCWRGQGKEE